MFSESMLNNMTGWELGHYIRQGSIDSLSSELVIKILDDYDERIENLKAEISDEEQGYDRGYSDAIGAMEEALSRLG